MSRLWVYNHWSDASKTHMCRFKKKPTLINASYLPQLTDLFREKRQIEHSGAFSFARFRPHNRKIMREALSFNNYILLRNFIASVKKPNIQKWSWLLVTDDMYYIANWSVLVRAILRLIIVSLACMNFCFGGKTKKYFSDCNMFEAVKWLHL